MKSIQTCIGARLLVLLLASVGLNACSVGDASRLPVSPPQAGRPGLILATTTDKAAYKPGEQVRIQVRLGSPAAAVPAGARLRLTVRHLERDAGPATDLPVGRADATVHLVWTAPAADYKGYSYEVALVDGSDQLLASETGAIDVSSSWLKFPRYGYVSQFAPGVDARAVVDQLKDYHINALQFYDWQWKHHRPLKGRPDAVEASWPDIANRTVSRDTVRGLIDAAHGAGMAAMQYNLIYGAAADFRDDGVSPSWGLYDSPGGRQWEFPLPRGWATSALHVFNPADKGWQDYLIARELDVFQAFAFDGWHADTVGDNGIKYDARGNPVDIKDTFKPFLNAAKARLGDKLLMMNVVGNKGHQQVNTSNVDAVYVEVWPWDGFPDYLSLKNVIDQARQESGGKSLIVPAYMNYDYARTKSDAAPGRFNAPGVLLTEATVLAAGGSRLELGDDGRMLCSEYFPSRALEMAPELKTAMRRYYDFAVAYENLLRDGQQPALGSVEIDGLRVSTDGAKDTVWAFAKTDARYETVNLINLTGLSDLSWRDTNATRRKPSRLGSFRLRYYTGARLAGAWVASPDAEGGRSRQLPLTAGRDARGAYAEVIVPGLEYWNLVYFRKSE